MLLESAMVLSVVLFDFFLFLDCFYGLNVLICRRRLKFIVDSETASKLDRIFVWKLPLMIDLCRNGFSLRGQIFLLFLRLSVLGIVIFLSLVLLVGVLDHFAGFMVDIWLPNALGLLD